MDRGDILDVFEDFGPISRLTLEHVDEFGFNFLIYNIHVNNILACIPFRTLSCRIRLRGHVHFGVAVSRVIHTRVSATMEVVLILWNPDLCAGFGETSVCVLAD